MLMSMSIKTKKVDKARRQREGSFTLIETVIALAIITFLILEVSTVQGNSIVFSDYGRNVTQASWLAKRVMSQIEYYARTKPFPDLMTEQKDLKFEDNDEYTYAVEIKEWKFPFVSLLQSTLGGKGKDEDGEPKEADPGISQMIQTVVDQIFGKEPIFLTAQVNVSWSEGATRNSTGLTYLLTNQAKLDEAMITLKPVWDRLIKAASKDKKPPIGSPGAPQGNFGGNVPPPPPPDGGIP
jgi:type II secretory pathway pseudopilin PulG